jgi:hypothetical protein
MITFAFAALEHNPIGGISSCNTLPPGIKITHLHLKNKKLIVIF